MRFDIDYYRNINLEYLNSLTGYDPSKEKTLNDLKRAVGQETYDFDKFNERVRNFFITLVDEIEGTISNAELYRSHKLCKINNDYDTRTGEKMTSSKPIYSPYNYDSYGDKMSFDSAINEIKSRVGIEDIIAKYYTNDYKIQNGKGSCLCPFHEEDTPSFSFDTQKNLFHCFGCGESGDQISFVEKYLNLSFKDAVKQINSDFGLNLSISDYDNSDRKNQNTVSYSYSKFPPKEKKNEISEEVDENTKLKIKEINRETARFYNNYLFTENGKKGLDYFTARGLSISAIRHFGLGYAPENRFDLINHLKKLGYTEAEMIQANVAYKSKSGYTMDRFGGRAIFPIIDENGTVVAFGGRALGDEKAKYVNTSETPIYKKNNELFAMNFAKNNSGQIILTEGYMDAIALHSVGITNAVASLGTALTENQVELIRKHCNEVVICYDSDTAGQNATQRAIPMLQKSGLTVKVISVPNGKDPDEFVKANGENAPVLFRKLIDESEIAEEINDDTVDHAQPNTIMRETGSDFDENLKAKLRLEIIPKFSNKASQRLLGSVRITVNDRFTFSVYIMTANDGHAYIKYPTYQNSKGDYCDYIKPSSPQSAKLITEAVLNNFNPNKKIDVTVGVPQAYSTVKIVRLHPFDNNGHLNKAYATICLDNLIDINCVSIKQYRTRENQYESTVSLPINNYGEIVNVVDRNYLNEINQCCVGAFTEKRVQYYKEKKNHRDEQSQTTERDTEKGFTRNSVGISL